MSKDWTQITDLAVRDNTGTHVEVVGSELIVHCGERHAAVIPVELLEKILQAGNRRAEALNTSLGVLDEASSLNTFRER